MSNLSSREKVFQIFFLIDLKYDNMNFEFPPGNEKHIHQNATVETPAK